MNVKKPFEAIGKEKKIISESLIAITIAFIHTFLVFWKCFALNGKKLRLNIIIIEIKRYSLQLNVTIDFDN